MGLRCKAGDMASVDHPTLPENKGLIVCIERFSFHESIQKWGWLTKPAWPCRGLYPNGIPRAPRDGIFFCEDWRLTPIRPPSPPESVDTPENVEATA